MAKMPVAIVEWEDAISYGNESIENVLKAKPSIVRTFGLVKYTKKYIIVQTHDGTQQNSDDFIRIPRSLVKKVRKVKHA
jgi:hypothetical protein